MCFNAIRRRIPGLQHLKNKMSSNVFISLRTLVEMLGSLIEEEPVVVALRMCQLREQLNWDSENINFVERRRRTRQFSDYFLEAAHTSERVRIENELFERLHSLVDRNADEKVHNEVFHLLLLLTCVPIFGLRSLEESLRFISSSISMTKPFLAAFDTSFSSIMCTRSKGLFLENDQLFKLIPYLNNLVSQHHIGKHVSVLIGKNFGMLQRFVEILFDRGLFSDNPNFTVEVIQIIQRAIELSKHPDHAEKIFMETIPPSRGETGSMNEPLNAVNRLAKFVLTADVTGEPTFAFTFRKKMLGNSRVVDENDLNLPEYEVLSLLGSLAKHSRTISRVLAGQISLINCLQHIQSNIQTFISKDIQNPKLVRSDVDAYRTSKVMICVFGILEGFPKWMDSARGNPFGILSNVISESMKSHSPYLQYSALQGILRLRVLEYPNLTTVKSKRIVEICSIHRLHVLLQECSTNVLQWDPDERDAFLPIPAVLELISRMFGKNFNCKEEGLDSTIFRLVYSSESHDIRLAAAKALALIPLELLARERLKEIEDEINLIKSQKLHASRRILCYLIFICFKLATHPNRHNIPSCLEFFAKSQSGVLRTTLAIITELASYTLKESETSSTEDTDFKVLNACVNLLLTVSDQEDQKNELLGSQEAEKTFLAVAKSESNRGIIGVNSKMLMIETTFLGSSSRILLYALSELKNFQINEMHIRCLNQLGCAISENLGDFSLLEKLIQAAHSQPISSELPLEDPLDKWLACSQDAENEAANGNKQIEPCYTGSAEKGSSWTILEIDAWQLCKLLLRLSSDDTRHVTASAFKEFEQITQSFHIISLYDLRSCNNGTDGVAFLLLQDVSILLECYFLCDVQRLELIKQSILPLVRIASNYASNQGLREFLVQIFWNDAEILNSVSIDESADISAKSETANIWSTVLERIAFSEVEINSSIYETNRATEELLLFNFLKAFRSKNELQTLKRACFTLSCPRNHKANLNTFDIASASILDAESIADFQKLSRKGGDMIALQRLWRRALSVDAGKSQHFVARDQYSGKIIAIGGLSLSQKIATPLIHEILISHMMDEMTFRNLFLTLLHVLCRWAQHQGYSKVHYTSSANETVSILTHIADTFLDEEISATQGKPTYRINLAHGDSNCIISGKCCSRSDSDDLEFKVIELSKTLLSGQGIILKRQQQTEKNEFLWNFSPHEVISFRETLGRELDICSLLGNHRSKNEQSDTFLKQISFSNQTTQRHISLYRNENLQGIPFLTKQASLLEAFLKLFTLLLAKGNQFYQHLIDQHVLKIVLHIAKITDSKSSVSIWL